MQYRELLVGMTRKELKVRYKNSVLGFAWSLVNPLLYLVVFYVAFDVILQASTPAFPLFLLSGLLVWNLFGTGLGRWLESPRARRAFNWTMAGLLVLSLVPVVA